MPPDHRLGALHQDPRYSLALRGRHVCSPHILYMHGDNPEQAVQLLPTYRVAQKSKPLLNDQKIVLNRIIMPVNKIRFIRQIKV